jgi:hypothetical protein
MVSVGDMVAAEVLTWTLNGDVTFDTVSGTLTDTFVLGASSTLQGRVVPEPSIPSDANGDGDVYEEDVAILAAHWGQTGDWWCCDFNADGVIGAADASILAANWRYGTSESGSVPEPGVIALLSGRGGYSLLWRGGFHCGDRNDSATMGRMLQSA